MVHVFVGLVYCEIPIILFDTRIRKSELGNISKVRDLKQWSMFQRFMANTWTTTWSLNSVFKRSGADLVTTMTSLFQPLEFLSLYSFSRYSVTLFSNKPFTVINISLFQPFNPVFPRRRNSQSLRLTFQFAEFYVHV